MTDDKKSIFDLPMAERHARMFKIIADGAAKQVANPFAKQGGARMGLLGDGDIVPKKKKRVQHEAKPTREIIDYIKTIGGFAWRQNNLPSPIYGPGGRVIGMRPVALRGISDILGVLPKRYGDGGIIIAVEVKSSTGKPSQDQIDFLDNIRRRGGVAIVARCVGDVEEALRKIPRK